MRPLIHPFQSLQDSHVGHGFIGVLLAGEDKLFSSRDGPQKFQYFDGLDCQRDNVRRLHFHSGFRDRPAPGVKVEFFPPCANQLAGTNKSESHEFDSQPRQLPPLIDFDGAEQRG